MDQKMLNGSHWQGSIVLKPQRIKKCSHLVACYISDGTDVKPTSRCNGISSRITHKPSETFQLSYFDRTKKSHRNTTLPRWNFNIMNMKIWKISTPGQSRVKWTN